MSEDKHYAGKLRRIPILRDQSLEEVCEELCKKHVHEKYHDINYYGSWQKCLEDNADFIISQGSIFEIYDLKDIGEYETLIVKESEENYTFSSHYYDGGTCLRECLEEELCKMNGEK